jgi:hypothetical protein
MELVLAAYHCKIIPTQVIGYVLIFRADRDLPAVENQAEADKILDTSIQIIQTTLEYQSP